MIVALIALFVSLGGVGYAATQLKKNSVGSKQIKKNAVTAEKVKDGSIGGAEVADGSLTGADVKAGSIGSAEVADKSLTGVDIADGSVALADLGADSVDGAKVVDGSLKSGDVAAGTFLGGAVTVQYFQAAADLPDGTSASYNAFCPAGQSAIGGGARGDATESEKTVLGSSRPSISAGNTEPPLSGQGFSGWRTTVLNPTGAPEAGIRPEVWVICAALP